jgi:hypothetical protein
VKSHTRLAGRHANEVTRWSFDQGRLQCAR